MAEGAKPTSSEKPTKVTALALAGRKGGGPRTVVVTAYDYAYARLADGAGVDVVLVGDSLGMVVQGQPTTLPVTLDEIIYHTRAGRARDPARARGRRHAVHELPGVGRGRGARRGAPDEGRAPRR